MTTDQWQPCTYELMYRLGELTLGRSRLNVLRKAYSLDEIRESAGEPVLPPMAADQEGYLLANIPRESITGSLDRRGALLYYCLKSYRRCYIDMSGDFEAYRSKFSGKTRSGINRKVRKFTESAGGLDFRRYRTPAELAEFFRLARPVSTASYQARLLDCGLPDGPEFVSESLAASAQDNVRAFLLFSQGQPVSYLYCPVRGRVLEYAFLGYVPEFAKHSPGTVLQWLALEELFAEQRFSAFDFTEGESEHKRFFSTHETPCSLQLVMRPTLRCQIVVRTHRGIDATSRILGDGLERLGLKNRVRKWLRQFA